MEVIGEVILEGVLFGIGLILPGYEGNHVEERSCFHSCVFQASHHISRNVAGDAWLQGCSLANPFVNRP